MADISTKELKVIDAISQNENISQRDIAEHSGFSLGLTNILINRLVKKGYLKASHLNARKIKYMITPKGLKEKAKKSYRFMKRSLSVMGQLNSIISDYVLERHASGKREFIIVGEGELADITELVINSLHLRDIKLIKAGGIGDIGNGSLILNTVQVSSADFNGAGLDIWGEAEKLYGSNYEF